MNYKELKNKSENTETLGADDEKLRRLLGSLKRVEAPKNFDFKLKARIAGGQPQNYRKPIFAPVLRYVLPLCVVVMLAAFVAFNMSSATDNQDVATSAGKIQPPQNAATPVDQTSTSPVPSGIVPAAIAATNAASEAVNQTESRQIPVALPSSPKFAAERNETKFVAAKIPAGKSARNNINQTKPSVDGGFEGTRDITQKIDEPLQLKGINPAAQKTNADNFARGSISLRGILAEIGIEADVVEKNWTILSVKSETPAMRSGLKSGDIIQSIDDKNLSPEIETVQSFTGKTFRITRGGKLMIIELNTK